MNIADVKTDIKNKTIQPYYIFAGEEIEIQRVYVNKIAEVLNYQVVRADRIADVWPSIITPTLFDDPCVYVVRDDKDFMQDEVLQRQIEQNKLNGNVIINLVSAFDKRSKWYKANSAKIVLFEHLTTSMLVKYCERLTKLNRANCERLIAICENDYSRMLLEIDKIVRFSSGNDDEAFEVLLAEGVIAVPPNDAVFELVDAILKRQPTRVYDLLDQCKKIGEANMVILSVLFTNAKQVLQVQACESDDISSSTGLVAWQINSAKMKCGRYTNDELADIMRKVQQVKSDILSGKIDDEISVDYLLVSIL